MNPADPTPPSAAPRLSQLIARLSDGTLTSQEAVALTELLRQDPAAQEAYLDHLAVDALLEREFGGSPALAQPPAPTNVLPFARPAGPARVRRSFSLSQLAAGLVVGFFLASAMWAYAVPWLGALGEKLLPLVDGNFEQNPGPAPEGLPTRTGVWSGDFVENVGPQSGIFPQSGRQMLRFLRADNQRSRQTTPVRASEVWQVIDLRPLRGVLGQGTVTLQLSGWFNAAPTIGGPYTSGLALMACRGEPADASELWHRKQELSLAESQKEERLDHNPKTWQRLVTQLAVPPEAELLLVQVRISDKSPTPPPGPSVFPNHYADNLSLRVVGSNAEPDLLP